MNYQKFHPDKLLQPFVECYYIWQSGEELADNLIVESPPNGFCSIGFNSADIYYLQNRKYEKLQVPREFVAGQSIYSYRLFLNGKISIAGIVFKPAALATMFNLPMHIYTEERVDLRDLFAVSLVKEYANAIAAEQKPLEKARLLEDFVMKEFTRSKPEPDYIDYAANLIVEKNGLLHVGELMDNIYMSRRNFERRFLKKVGLSPKYYARIRRISYLLNIIAGRKKVDWASIFSECEFYDKSHFIKDFQEFTGRTPQQYLEENKELANFMQKPASQSLH